MNALDDITRELLEASAELGRLRAAASAVLFFRHADGTFVDGWRAQELLNELAALLPPDYPHWPGKLKRDAP